MKKPLKQWIKKVCKQCNTPFETKYDKKIYCNNRCKCEWHNQRERNRIQSNSSDDNWQYGVIGDEWGMYDGKGK